MRLLARLIAALGRSDRARSGVLPGQMLPWPNASRGILCCYDEYAIEFEHEQAYLRWPGGTFPVGDHYGNPICAEMNTVDGWCVVGGEGLVVTSFDNGFPVGNDRCDASKVKQMVLWRERGGAPLADGRKCWWVCGAWFAGGDRVHVAVNPGDDDAGLYEVNVGTLAWRKI